MSCRRSRQPAILSIPAVFSPFSGAFPTKVPAKLLRGSIGLQLFSATIPGGFEALSRQRERTIAA